MKTKNEMFKVAFDWLCKNKGVKDQNDLALKIGVAANTISRIMNDETEVSDATLRKMNDAFGGIFNMAYFRGESVLMLMDDVDYYRAHPDEHPLAQKKQASPSEVPAWTDALIQLVSENVRIAEELKREHLELRSELTAIRKQLANISRSLPYPSLPENSMLIAAENTPQYDPQK